MRRLPTFLLSVVMPFSVVANELMYFPAMTGNEVMPSITEFEVYRLPDNLIELEISFTNGPSTVENLEIGFSTEDGKIEPQVWYRLEDLSISIEEHPADNDVVVVTISMPQDEFYGVFIRTGMGEESTYAPINEQPKVVSEKLGRSAMLAATCQPQCTTYVANRTHISFKKCWGKQYGNAGEWYDYAKKCGFSTSSTPKSGAIGEIKSPGHVFQVISVDKKSQDKYNLVLTDANWNNACGVRPSFNASYDKASKKITMGGNSKYSLTGFITKW